LDNTGSDRQQRTEAGINTLTELIPVKKALVGAKIVTVSAGPLMAALFTRLQLHHLIPSALKNGSYGMDVANLIAKGVQGGFVFDDVAGNNRMWLQVYSRITGLGIHGNHPRYSEYVALEIQNFISSRGGLGNINPQNAADFLRKLADNMRTQIDNLRRGGLSQRKWENLNTSY
jgi:hypothetical protein